MDRAFGAQLKRAAPIDEETLRAVYYPIMKNRHSNPAEIPC